MTGLLLSIAAFIVALGLLVTVHEFGHFWVARRLGIKVLRFSIGFGFPLWSRQAGPDQTEYRLAAIPLGGYVKMLDETEGPVSPAEAHQAFNRQPLVNKTLVVLAGPVANILFAILAYWLMFVVGIAGPRPLLGEIPLDSAAAQANLRSGQMILQVEGRPTPTWEAVTLALVRAALRRDGVELETVDEYQQHRFHHLALATTLARSGSVLHHLGLVPGWLPLPAVMGKLEGEGSGIQAGFQPGDRVVEADGKPVSHWEQWVRYVRSHPEQAIAVVVEREGARLDLTVTPKAYQVEGETIGRIGAAVQVSPEYETQVRAVLRYDPLEAIGVATAKVWDISALTLGLLGKMLTGEASVENLSGPISIAQYAGQSAAIGFAPFLAFLGIVSLSLGILNLLPIPVLDGGHLLYYLAEFIRGKPLSEQVLLWSNKLGITLLLGLMALAITNDFTRLFRS